MPRFPRDLSENATTRLLRALRQRGVDVVDLTVSNPTRVGFDYPANLLAPLSSVHGLIYEPHPFGMRSAREAVAGDYARRGLAVSADRVALTASTSEAYAWLFKLLCDPDDQVLVPRPSYPLLEHLAGLESVEARTYALEYHGTWRIDFESVRRALDARTRAVLVVSPNNPTGSYMHRDDIAELEQICAERGLIVIADEVFADFPLDAPDGDTRPAPAAVATCRLGGLSKSVGLPQAKLSWIAFDGPEAQIAPLMSACEFIADTYLSVSTPVQVALPALLENGAVVRRQIQQRIRRNLDALSRMTAETPAVSLPRVEGGWSAVMQVPAYRSEESLVLELLTEDHVLVHPGYFFDFDREAFLVVSLLVEPDQFDRGVGRLLQRAAHTGVTS